jgi:ribonuclease HII
MNFPSYKKEQEQMDLGYDIILGCDEVGVGPLAGPVVACACLLDKKSIGKSRTKNKWYYRVRDSKTTSELERQVLLKEILKHTVAYGIGEVWQKDIDKLNIHVASLKAMKIATEKLLKKLKIKPRSKVLVFVDGRFKIPKLGFNQKSVVKGDRNLLSIASASIIAKVHRDNIMHKYDALFPEYGFSRNKGYSTKEHQKAIKKLGPIALHRKSFLKNLSKK